MTLDPPRLRDPASGVSDSLRELLRSSTSDGPSAAQLQQLAARLEPQLASPPEVPAPASPAATTLGAGKAIVATVIVAVVAVTGAYWLGRADSPRPSAPLASAHSPVIEQAPSKPSAPVVRDEPAAPATPVVPSVPSSPGHRTANRRTPVHPPPALPVIEAPASPSIEPTEDELAILGHAQRALVAADARTALSQAERHAEKFPSGIMVEEREAIAIEALAGLGRLDDARTRFERFRTSYARSSYRHRLERLVLTNR